MHPTTPCCSLLQPLNGGEQAPCGRKATTAPKTGKTSLATFSRPLLPPERHKKREKETKSFGSKSSEGGLERAETRAEGGGVWRNISASGRKKAVGGSEKEGHGALCGIYYKGVFVCEESELIEGRELVEESWWENGCWLENEVGWKDEGWLERRRVVGKTKVGWLERQRVSVEKLKPPSGR